MCAEEEALLCSMWRESHLLTQNDAKSNVEVLLNLLGTLVNGKAKVL